MTDLEGMSVAEFLKQVGAGWNALQSFVGGLSEEQLSGPTDAAGWTVKDHLTHLAVWEDGITALLNHESRYGAMGLDRETFLSGDYDRMNEVIRQQHIDKSVPEALDMLNSMHNAFIEKTKSMTDADIQRPYNEFATDSDRDAAVINWMVGDSYSHYEEHIPWMSAIIEDAY